MGRKKRETTEVFMEEYVDQEEEEIDPELIIDKSVESIEIKEDKLLTSKYNDNTISDKDKKASETLNNDLTLFLEETIGVKSNENNTTIPTGIDLLDTVLGGGIGTKFVMFVGPPGCGKSALAAKVIATGQKKWPGQFIGIYLDSEETMSKQRLKELGIKNPELTPKNDLTVESVFKTIDALCAFKSKRKDLVDIPSIVVWDSIANTNPEGAEDASRPEEITGLRARLLSFFLPKYIKRMNKYNIALLSVGQLRDKIDFGPIKKANDLKFLGGFELPGGKAMKYNLFQIVYMSQTGSVKDEYGEDVICVKGRTVKNKLFTPNIDINMVFSFRKGFSNFWTNFELLKETKRIAAGAWCYLIEYPEKKFRQKEALGLYKEDSKFKEIFDRNIEEVLKKDYIEKYKYLDDNDII